jgi:hypothetical protein
MTLESDTDVPSSLTGQAVRAGARQWLAANAPRFSLSPAPTTPPTTLAGYQKRQKEADSQT